MILDLSFIKYLGFKKKKLNLNFLLSGFIWVQQGGGALGKASCKFLILWLVLLSTVSAEFRAASVLPARNGLENSSLVEYHQDAAY